MMTNQNESALAYFARMQNSQQQEDDFYNRPEVWDERARAWEAQYGDPKSAKSEDRVQATLDYLLEQALLTPGCDVVDIGCGPGRFVAGFARTARHVLGIDFSQGMIEQAQAYAQSESLGNVSFMVRDFVQLDIEREGLAGEFDLVLASNTPAVHGVAGLEKAMGLSRGHCLIVTQIHSENRLESQIMREVFGHSPRPGPSGQWFYAAWNLLYLLGYYPQTSYYSRHSECHVGSDYAGIFMERMLPLDQRTPESEGRIRKWLGTHAGPDGRVSELRDIKYGRLLWDVREKNHRPTYPAPGQGGR